MFIFFKSSTVLRPKTNSALIGLPLLLIIMIFDRDPVRGKNRKAILLHPVPPQSRAAWRFIIRFGLCSDPFEKTSFDFRIFKNPCTACRSGTL
jgi:hypothetical protein